MTTTLTKIIDLETRPRKDLARKHAKPYPTFDEDTVKCGNLGPDKAREKRIKASDDHDAGEEKYYLKKEEDAGLVPEFSEICTIGFLHAEGKIEILEKSMSETQMIMQAWDYIKDARYKFAGHTVKNFDLRMLIKRSWLLGIKIPMGMFNVKGGRLYPTERIIDIAEVWNLGESNYDLMKDCRQWSLSYIAKQFGVECKRDYPVKAKTFHKFWDSDQSDDNAMAIQYVTDDLIETAVIVKILDI